MIRKPNLFVIGAMKSGTTSLCQCLGTHPDIFMVPVKEPMHFSREEKWSVVGIEGIQTLLVPFLNGPDVNVIKSGNFRNRIG